jgi:hypothetical protein
MVAAAAPTAASETSCRPASTRGQQKYPGLNYDSENVKTTDSENGF